MTVSRAKGVLPYIFLIVLIALGTSVPQNRAASRDASFAPLTEEEKKALGDRPPAEETPGDKKEAPETKTETPAPVTAAPPPPPAKTPSAAQPPITPAAAPQVTPPVLAPKPQATEQAPAQNAPKIETPNLSKTDSTPPPKPQPTPQTQTPPPKPENPAPATPLAPKADAAPPAKPQPEAAAQSVTPSKEQSAPAQQPPAPESAAPPAPQKQAPENIAKPVAAEPLANVDPDSLGLLAAGEGGLGASMWNKTPRELADKLMSGMNLPSASPALNNLARRLLVSAAAVPAGEKVAPIGFLSLRIEKLLALGGVPEAWKLATMAKPEQLDSMTVRAVTEAALIGPDSKDICERMPRLMSGKDNENWQQDLILCQIRAGDDKAAQLSLDVMREQQIKDDVFIMLANRAMAKDGKRLPRNLTPLRPAALGVLRHMEAPLPSEIFVRPDAMFIPELLKAKAENDNARLTLAEKAAARGIIGAQQLADVYDGVAFQPDSITNAINGMETGERNHALLFQAVDKETDPSKRAELIKKWMQASESDYLTGAGGQLIAARAEKIPATADNAAFSAAAARLFALTGNPSRALEWRQIARAAAEKNPVLTEELNASWPLFVLAGIVAEAEYGKELKTWLDSLLKDQSLEPPVLQQRRKQAGNALMLFNAAGYGIPEEAWQAVVETVGELKKRPMPPTVLLERLRAASSAGNKAEVVLLAIILMENGAKETPLFVTAEVIKALRLVDLKAEALALARETALQQ